MQKTLLVILLTFCFIQINTKETHAQNTAPTYKSVITLGDNEFNKGEYIKAKSYYQEALRLKKDDITAKNKLNKTLEKIREQSEKEEIFYQHIDEADNHYEKGDYEKALASYKKAKNIFSNDSYTTDRIKEITEIINNEKDKIASFNEIVKIADNFMTQEKYTEATLQYKIALELYPNNVSVKGKYENARNKKEEYDTQTSIYESLKREGHEFALRKKYAESIEKYQEALNLRPNDTETQNIINSLTDKKNTFDKYNTAVNEADRLYLEKSYEKAKVAYNEALTIIPDDSYSIDMINRINETLTSDEYQSLKNYLAYIEEAKALENQNDIDAALTKYKLALKTNPGDEFATQKIDFLTNTINNRNREIELNAQYTSLINKGDSCCNSEDYYTALDYYTQAYNLIPDRTEAKEKKENTHKIIKDIEAQLALEKQKWEEYYHTAMTSAQKFMNEKNYADAIKEYNKALRYKENDITATQGLNNATQLNEARLAALSAEYSQYISNADIQFEGKNYDKAIEFYAKAEALETGNTYPSEMINKISNILQENKLVQLVDSKLEILANQTKRFTFNPVDVTTRKNNYIIIKAKNISENGYTMFISYGSSKGNSGSFILRIPNNQETNDYIIRIGSQYKWFSEDNTWIELTPENGSIEIELMEITKGN